MLKKANGHDDRRRSEFVEQMQEPKLQRALKAFAISLSGNADRADDLVQETNLRALANYHTFEPGTNLQAWMFTILRNLFRSEYRKRRREAEWDEGYDNMVDISTGLFSLGGDEIADYNLLLKFVATLPADQRDAIVAIGYLGLSYEQAAEIFGCAVGTIKSRTNRAREKLVELMREGKIISVDLSPLKEATTKIPKSSPYYVIAEAYATMYNDIDSVNVDKKAQQPQSEREELWEKLVASGALDEGDGIDELSGGPRH